MLDHCRLRQVVSGVEATLLDRVTLDDLATAPGDAYLDLWYGQDDTSGYLNYTAHGAYYDSNALRAAWPSIAYARVLHADDGRAAIQYWLFYYYNDWYNKHEGDWEMIQVELDATGQPTRAIYAQHHGGSVRPWSAVEKTDGTHPHAYVALGSHATYFVGDTLYPAGEDIGNVRVDVYDRTGRADPIIPAIQLISDTDPAWLVFAGRWGERAFGDFAGPTGPAQKGTQWSDPFAWADLQPSDAARWYHRHVRGEARGLSEAASLSLSPVASVEKIVESAGRRQTIVAFDPLDPALDYQLRLQTQQTLSPTLLVEWPDALAGTIARREYSLELPMGASAELRLCRSCDFRLNVDTDGDGVSDASLRPGRSSVSRVDFDPPESVVFYLPPEQIIGGLLIALLAAVVPSVGYALGVWWLDRYEKEPKRLLIATFLWGALPGALIALAARFLVAGTFAPVITESVKAVGVWIVFIRYRREFDDLLDGIVYGAMTGLGFAMMTNFVSYAIGFLFGGLEFLRARVLLNGIAFGLSEAYYGAVIGIGFGVSRWAADPPLRKTAPFLGLSAAILLHLFNDFWRGLAVGAQSGLVAIPFLATWVGIVAVVAIAILSIRKEQATIRTQLKDEIERGTFTPNEYFYLSTPRRRSQQLFNAARRGPADLARSIRLQNLAAQLAFRRQELALAGQDPEADADVRDLRQRIAALQPVRRARDHR